MNGIQMPIVQKNGNDCVLAAIAMAVCREYDDLWSPEDVAKVVADRGVSDWEPWMLKAGFKRTDWRELHLRHDDQAVVKTLLWGRMALLSVGSLHHEHGYHAVFWDRERLWDPSNLGAGYKHLGSVHIMRALLLKEPKA